jgi:uncharacterized protein
LQSNKEKNPNRLIKEKSPYLLQHAYNPVDWYPWSQEALDKAKAEDKPIFLSIGYSSCHWCHVMEQECFEDEEVAKLLNAAFVCIKVDREERPDLDAAYMAACQAMGRNCGWPLNLLITPKLNPFFAASYIPKYSQAGLVGMLDLVPQVLQIWKIQRSQLEIVGADIKARIQALEKRLPQQELEKAVLQKAYDNLVLDFDNENGGFGWAPKFPTPHKLLYLLRYYKRTGEKNALSMAEKTLRKMRLGGIFDQVGLGFHRYSTDARWLVPHFEKMLYDQALLALAYTEAYHVTGAPKFMVTAKETLNFVLRDLAFAEGGFYSAMDADTEGEEGKYYLWTTQEIKDALPPQNQDLAVQLFGLTSVGNFSGSKGKNILYLPLPLEEIASQNSLTIDQLIMRLGAITDALYQARKKRSPPAIDDKILVDWNGFVIAALAKAGIVLNEPKYLSAAKKTVDFILNRMLKNGTLYHRFVKSEAAVEGFLDDYAFFVYGLIELYEATFIDKYLQTAAELTKTMVVKFWDSQNGGFYQTQENEAAAMPKIKQLYDGATPSGNSVALYDLLWLSRLTNESAYEAMAVQMTKAFGQEVEGAPEAFAFFLSAFDFQIGPSSSVVLVGDLKETGTQEMLNALRKQYLPTTVIQLKAPGKAGLGYEQLEGKATAYVCRGQTCLPPTNNVALMLEQLGA